MSAEADAALMRAWAAGDQRSGSELFERHAPAVARFFRNKTDSIDVPDLIQTTFLTCFERVDKLRADASFRAFVLGVARNVLLRHYRDRQRKRDKIDFGVSSILELGASPSGILAEKQQEQRLLAALRKLPVEHQILLELVYWEGLRGPELAEVFEVPEGTIRTRLRRARQLLADAFEALGHGGAAIDPGSFETWARQLREHLDREPPR